MSNTTQQKGGNKPARILCISCIAVTKTWNCFLRKSNCNVKSESGSRQEQTWQTKGHNQRRTTMRSHLLVQRFFCFLQRFNFLVQCFHFAENTKVVSNSNTHDPPAFYNIRNFIPSSDLFWYKIESLHMNSNRYWSASEGQFTVAHVHANVLPQKYSRLCFFSVWMLLNYFRQGIVLCIEGH